VLAGLVITTVFIRWAFRDDAGESPGAPPSLTELVVRDVHSVRLWRAVSDWLSARLAQNQDWHTGDTSAVSPPNGAGAFVFCYPNGVREHSGFVLGPSDDRPTTIGAIEQDDIPAEIRRLVHGGRSTVWAIAVQGESD
jgi:hypothetical protein